MPNQPAITYLPIEVVHLNDDNPRLLKDARFEQLVKSIQEFPEMLALRPLVIDETSTVLGGNMRLRALQHLGYTEVPVMIASSLTDEQKREFIIKDNGSFGEWDWDALANGDWPEASVLNDWGINLPPDWSTDITVVPAAEEQAPSLSPPLAPITVSGDLYELNGHAVLCGDCRNFDDVQKLIDALGGRPINMAVTSPPYAAQREYDPASGFTPIAPDEYVAWYSDVASNILCHLAPDGSYFCNIKEHVEEGVRHLYVKDLTLAHVREWGWKLIDEFCWERIGMPGAFAGRFKNAWEPIFHFALQNGSGLKFFPYEVGHASDNIPVYSKETNLNPVGSLTGIPADRAQARAKSKNRETRDGVALPGNRLPPFQTDGTEHSAAFPIGLPEFFIKAFSARGDVCYDPFLGSGTTLMAAEQQGRVCIGTELSPRYTDVIVRRWLTYMQENERPYQAKRNGVPLSEHELTEFVR